MTLNCLFLQFLKICLLSIARTIIKRLPHEGCKGVGFLYGAPYRIKTDNDPVIENNLRKSVKN